MKEKETQKNSKRRWERERKPRGKAEEKSQNCPKDLHIPPFYLLVYFFFESFAFKPNQLARNLFRYGRGS